MTSTHKEGGGGNFGVKKCKICVFLKQSSSLLPGIDQTNYVYSNEDQGGIYQSDVGVAI